ncbi:hypothetical protein Tco_0195286, partial [Tanacetum coccineum]
DDHDLLVNSNNENDDMLGYESEKYSDEEDADGTNHAEDTDETNHSDMKLVKRGITRLYKFRMEYGKPGGIKIKVTFDALNRVSGLHRAMFLSFLEDLVREHIGLKILSWKKVRYFDVDLTVRKLIKNKEIEADEEPPRCIMWLKGRVNKDRELTNDEIRSVGDKLKEADDKIKEGTLNLDDGTDAMTVVFGKEKGGYARGVGSGVTYKRYFHLPRSRQVTDERVELLQTQHDNERRGSSQKVTPMGAYEVDGTQSSVVVRDKDARIQKKSNGLVTSKKEPVKTVRPKKTPKSRRNGSQDSQSQGNVSPTQELPTGMQHATGRGNNRFKKDKDGVCVYVLCIPKIKLDFDERVTPPTTIQKISDYNSAPKLQSKRKNYVSRETMQRQARTGKSHKSLNYGS